MKDNIPIVYCVNGDELALRWLKYSIESVRRFCNKRKIIVISNSDDIDIDCDKLIDATKVISEYDLRVTERMTWHKKPASPMMMMRMFIPYFNELLKLDKCLYLDIDTEIVDERFNKIFDLDVEGFHVAGVLDQRNNPLKREAFSRRCRQFIWRNNLPFQDRRERLYKKEYINSGVMMMNLSLMRNDFREESISRFVHLSMKDNINCMSKLMDQDIINAIYSVKIISSSFNTFKASHELGNPVYCLHHVGRDKIEKYPVLKKEDFK